MITFIFRFLIFSLITFSISSKTYSQGRELTTIDNLPFKDVSDIKLTSDQEGNICLFHHTNGFTNYNLYNSTGILKAFFKFKATNPPTIIGILPKNGIMSVYYKGKSNINGRSINLLKMNIKDSTYTSILKIPILKSEDEKLIKYLELNNFLYVITHQVSSNQLKVKVFSGEDTFEAHEFIFTSEQLKSISKAVDIDYMEEGSDLSIEYSTTKNKVYYKDSVLQFTLDGFRLNTTKNQNHTEIIQLNLANKESKYTLISSPIDYAGYSNNSFLLDTTLFRVSLSRQLFNLSIYSTNTHNKPLKSFSFDSKDEFTINDDLVNYQGFLSTIILSDTKEILKKLNKGDLAISGAFNTNGSVKLLIGSYLIASAPMGMSGVPGVSINTYYNRIGASAAITSFESTLSMPDLEKTRPGYYNFNKSASSIDAYLKSIDAKVSSRSSFHSQGRIFLAYVDYKQKSIKLVRLGR